METTVSKEGIILRISKDKLKAELHITNTALSRKKILFIIKDLLKSQGIRYGLQTENLKNALHGSIQTTPFIIARGRKPRMGRPPRIEKLIDFPSEKKIFQKTSNDRVNYKEIIRYNIVEKDTPLLRILPAEPGIPGKNILGEVIPPPPMPDKNPVRLGKNVAYDKNDPTLIIATSPGMATFSETGKIEVFDTFEVDGDIDLDTGNVRFPGRVIVNGDVKAGFIVEAREDVIIYGSVEDAQVQAGRDIIVHQGFSGGIKGRLQAGRDIQVAFARNGKLEAHRDIFFEVELIACRTRAYRAVKSSDGRVVGGRTEAMESIQIRSAGSEEEVRTILVVGQKKVLNEERNALLEQIKEYQKAFDANKERIYLLVVKKLDRKISAAEAQELEELQQRQEEIKGDLNRFKALLETVQQKYEKLKKAYIRINGVVYPNVEVHVGEGTWLNQEKLHYITLYEKDERVRITRI